VAASATKFLQCAVLPKPKIIYNLSFILFPFLDFKSKSWNADARDNVNFHEQLYLLYLGI
jgi:hypothetical protein